MVDSALTLRVVAISAPWLAAILAAAARRRARGIGVVAAAVSVLASADLLHAAPAGRSLGEALMVLFSCLAVGAMLVLPRRDCNSRTIAGMLFVLGSTLLAYATENLLVLLAAWILTTVPFLSTQLFGAASWRPRLGLLLSSVTLALATGLIAAQGHAMSIGRLTGPEPRGNGGFWAPGCGRDLPQRNLPRASLGRGCRR